MEFQGYVVPSVYREYKVDMQFEMNFHSVNSKYATSIGRKSAERKQEHVGMEPSKAQWHSQSSVITRALGGRGHALSQGEL